MANETFKGMLIGLAIFVVFASLMITLVVDFGQEYGMNTSQVFGGALNEDDFTTSASDMNASSSGYAERFEKADLEDTDAPTGLFTILGDMKTMVVTPFTLLGRMMNSFGVPSLLISIIMAGISITLIFAIWRVLKQG